MAIQRYQDSFSDSMPGTFSSMLDQFFNNSLASRGRVNSFSPQADAYETGQGYNIDVALPGMQRNDIKVDFHQGRLTISGERNFQNERNDRRYHLVESSYGSFQRSFQLPDTVDAGKIEATFEDGMLHVLVPKDEQKTMRHQIEVRGGQNGGSPGSPSGRMSEKMGQQATDVPVQDGDQSGNDQSSNQPQDQPQGSGVGS